MRIRLTIFFSEPFWIGVFERIHNGNLEVSRITFGAELTDAEVLFFIRAGYAKLIFTAPIEADVLEKRINPKRLQRLIRREVSEITGIGTRAQEACKRDFESRKNERVKLVNVARKREDERRFEIKIQKRKQKHRGK